MKSLKAIVVYCGRPDCDERAQLPVECLQTIDRRAGVVKVRAESVSSLMVVIEGWAFGISPTGVLYGICPADATASSMSPDEAG